MKYMLFSMFKIKIILHYNTLFWLKYLNFTNNFFYIILYYLIYKIIYMSYTNIIL